MWNGIWLLETLDEKIGTWSFNYRAPKDFFLIFSSDEEEDHNHLRNFFQLLTYKCVRLYELKISIISLEHTQKIMSSDYIRI